MGKRAAGVALGGVLTAVSLLLLYVAALSPSGKLGIVALAGLVPAVGVISGGLAVGFACYAATGILGVLLLPDKGCAVLYLVLLGLYPVLKSLIERLRKLVLELILKLVFFNAVLSVLVYIFSALLFPFLSQQLQNPLLIYLVGNVVFLVYDFGMSKLLTYYAIRIRPAIRKH